MTVRELRERLADLPADRRVLVMGYEDGYTEPRLLVDKEVTAVDPVGYWSGEWQAAGHYRSTDGSIEPAVVIAR